MPAEAPPRTAQPLVVMGTDTDVGKTVVAALLVRAVQAEVLSRSGNLVHARRSPDVATIYVMTQTVIIPSQWEEPFGRIAVEAMHTGIPVIASRTGGLEESVGEGGLLVDDFTNVDAWASAIERLDDPKERKQVVKAGKQHVKQFSLSREVDKLIEILEQVSA